MTFLANRALRLPHLDGLRGLAAVAVALFHAPDFFDNPVTRVLAQSITAKGYLGVDLFALFSGFIIYGVYGRIAWGRGHVAFLANRIARIYPAHLGTMVLLFALLWAQNPAQLAQAEFADSLVANLALVQAWGVLDHPTWNWPAWSLSSEWLCYLIYPALAGVALWRRQGWWRLAIVAAAFTTLAAIEYAHASLDVTVLTGTLRMGVEFMVGLVLAAELTDGRRRALPDGGNDAACAILIAALGWFWRDLTDTALVALLFLIGHFTVHAQSWWRRTLEWPPLLFLGELSYVLYLVHTIVYRLAQWLKQGHGEQADLAAFLASLAVALVVSWALNRWWETPARRWLRDRLAPLTRG